MATPGISAEAKGRLRLLVAQLTNDALRIEAASDRLPRQLLRDLAKKGEIGASRSLARVLDGMPIRPFHCGGRSLAFRYLAPVQTVPAAIGVSANAADEQTAILMRIVMINGDGNRKRMTREPFGVGFTSHALGRLLDRSAFSVDPIAAMFEAHDALLLLPPAEGELIFDCHRVPVPAAGGIFISSPRRIGSPDSPSPFCVARTWVSADDMHADQVAGAAAWRTMIAKRQERPHVNTSTGDVL